MQTFINEYIEERGFADASFEKVKEHLILQAKGQDNPEQRAYWTGVVDASVKRLDKINKDIIKMRYAKHILNKKLARNTRKAFIRSGLRNGEGTDWIDGLQQLRNERDPKQTAPLKGVFGDDEEEDLVEPDEEEIDMPPIFDEKFEGHASQFTIPIEAESEEEQDDY
ncbi:hypothetical protein EG329_009122 [Mollisiaceae sp. DMI_Dod_QoI]|nr:hypothetical protein EG329_009122 [Helotiales sp. DMI_Dod_QoI]